MHVYVSSSSSYFSPAQRYRRKEIILHSVHRPNNLLKYPFVALLIYHLHLLHKHTSPKTHTLHIHVNILDFIINDFTSLLFKKRKHIVINT